MQILVIGAGGFFGRVLTAELLQFTDAKLIIAGRNLDNLEALRRGWNDQWQVRAEIERLDLLDTASLARVLPRCQIAVCAAGPFQDMPHSLLRACLAQNVHYIDLADDRAFVLEALEICQKTQPSCVVAPGWSAVPALSALLADIAAQDMQKIESIRIAIAPGNRAPRSASTVASLLDSLGKPFRLWRRDHWQDVTGWSELMAFPFPLPVGSRSGALVDVPDLEIFPQLFGASTVEFRVGAELMVLNHATSLLAQIVRMGILGSMRPWAKPMRALMSLTGGVGHDWGCLSVECQGFVSGQAVAKTASIVADHHGHHIPAMPAVILCGQLLHGDAKTIGVPPWRSWLSGKELQEECQRRGYRLIVN